MLMTLRKGCTRFKKPKVEILILSVDCHGILWGVGVKPHFKSKRKSQTSDLKPK